MPGQHCHQVKLAKQEFVTICPAAMQVVSKLVTMANSTEPRGLNGQKLGQLCRALSGLQSGAYNRKKMVFISLRMMCLTSQHGWQCQTVTCGGLGSPAATLAA
jgi:hypothetical protein